MDGKLTILGARGSIPVSGERYSLYGGATACVLLEVAGGAVVFDAGTGFLNLPAHVWRERELHVFLSHLHLDHLLGIPMSPVMYDEEARVVFHSENADACEKALEALMARPLWPVGPEAFRAKVAYRGVCHEAAGLPGGIRVTAMQVSHPGGCLAYRADYGGAGLVYATDCELDGDGCAGMAAFARNARWVILDAQYTEEEARAFKGRGHNGAELAASVIADSGAASGLLFHHDPARTDERMAEIEDRLRGRFPQVSAAREGEVIT